MTATTTLFRAAAILTLTGLPLLSAGCSEGTAKNSSTDNSKFYPTGDPPREERATNNTPQPAAAKSIYADDAYLKTLSRPLPPRRRDWSASEQGNIDRILSVVKTDNFEGWKTAREALVRMGNGAVEQYIVAMLERLANDSKRFVNPGMDYQHFTVEGDLKDAALSLDDRRAPDDFDYLDDDIWLIVESELGLLGAEAVVPLLVAVKSCRSAAQSYLFGHILSNYGDEALIPMLVALRDTDDEEFRYRLTYLLRNFPDERTSSALTTVLERGATGRLRAQAAESLALAGLSAAIPRIGRAMAAERDPFVRRYTIYALGHMNDPRGLQLVTEALNDPDDSVWAQAALVVAHRKHVPAMPALLSRLTSAQSRAARDPEMKKQAEFIVENLKQLTGFNLGDDVEKWRRWYDSEKNK